MVLIRQGDEDPKVVLVQIALSTRLPQTPLRVDGKFGAKTKAAVQVLQEKLPRPQTGVVEAPEWKAMMEAMPFEVFDATWIDNFGSKRTASIKQPAEKMRRGCLVASRRSASTSDDASQPRGAAGGWSHAPPSPSRMRSFMATNRRSSQ